MKCRRCAHNYRKGFCSKLYTEIYRLGKMVICKPRQTWKQLLKEEKEWMDEK